MTEVIALRSPRSLLEPGHGARWEQVNAAKRDLLAAPGAGDSVATRLRRGQRLSAQAAKLRRAVAGHEHAHFEAIPGLDEGH